MPDINNLPGGAATSVNLTDKIYVAQGSNDRSATISQVQAALGITTTVPQFTVAASGNLTLVFATHQGGTIILAGASATVTINATNLGDGFVCKVINDSGADWTVPTPTGGTLRFDVSGQTKILAGGSGAFETYTRGGTRYVHVVGITA